MLARFFGERSRAVSELLSSNITMPERKEPENSKQRILPLQIEGEDVRIGRPECQTKPGADSSAAQGRDNQHPCQQARSQIGFAAQVEAVRVLSALYHTTSRSCLRFVFTRVIRLKRLSSYMSVSG